MGLLGGALSIAGGLLGSSGAKKAAKSQEKAAKLAAETQRYMYDTTREDYAPYREVGTAALNRLRDLQMGDAAAREAAMEGFYTDPGYQFRLDEGRRALENSALARGGFISGNTGRALVDYGQGMGSAEYGNYYNRLANLASIGQTATNQLGALGAGAAGRMGQAQLAAGQARGSGYIGAADAWGNALQGVGRSLGYGGGFQNPFANWNLGNTGTTPYAPPQNQWNQLSF